MFLETRRKENIFVLGPSSAVTGGRPFLNVPQTGVGTFTSFATLADKKTRLFWVKRTPEALGIIRVIAMDIITKLDFQSVVSTEGKKGRPSTEVHTAAETKAKKFAKEHQVKQTLLAAVMDWLATGDAYIWIGEDFDDLIKEISKIAIKEFNKYGITDLEGLNVKDLIFIICSIF